MSSVLAFRLLLTLELTSRTKNPVYSWLDRGKVDRSVSGRKHERKEQRTVPEKDAADARHQNTHWEREFSHADETENIDAHDLYTSAFWEEKESHEGHEGHDNHNRNCQRGIERGAKRGTFIVKLFGWCLDRVCKTSVCVFVCLTWVRWSSPNRHLERSSPQSRNINSWYMYICYRHCGILSQGSDFHHRYPSISELTSTLVLRVAVEKVILSGKSWVDPVTRPASTES